MWSTLNNTNTETTVRDFPLTVDLETTDPTEEDILIEREFAPTGNTKKPEIIKKKRDELKLAATDSAPIWCVGIKTPIIFYSVSQAILSEEEKSVLIMLGWQVHIVYSELELLAVYAGLLASFPNNSRFIAAGDFDLHKSRFRYAANMLPVPNQLFTFKYSDLMQTWQYFTKRRDKQYTAVKEMAMKLHIDYDLTMDGSEIPKAIEDGKHFDVLMKNYKDCIIEEEIAYRLMSNKLQR